MKANWAYLSMALTACIVLSACGAASTEPPRPLEPRAVLSLRTSDDERISLVSGSPTPLLVANLNSRSTGLVFVHGRPISTQVGPFQYASADNSTDFWSVNGSLEYTLIHWRSGHVIASYSIPWAFNRGPKDTGTGDGPAGLVVDASGPHVLMVARDGAELASVSSNGVLEVNILPQASTPFQYEGLVDSKGYLISLTDQGCALSAFHAANGNLGLVHLPSGFIGIALDQAPGGVPVVLMRPVNPRLSCRDAALKAQASTLFVAPLRGASVGKPIMHWRSLSAQVQANPGATRFYEVIPLGPRHYRISVVGPHSQESTPRLSGSVTSYSWGRAGGMDGFVWSTESKLYVLP